MNLKPSRFIFKSTSFEPQKRQVRFLYEIEFKGKKSLKFTETLLLPRVPGAVPKELLKKLLESVHLMLGISYYKLYCPEKVKVPYALTEEQAAFWTTVYSKGLGEFAYRNKLDPRKFAKFPAKKSAKAAAIDFERTDRSLLGIGGGKDSIVAGELMKEAGKKFDAFLAETERPSPVVANVVKTMKVNSLTVMRKLDPKIFEKHEGSYNGHVPISGVFAFLGLLSAVLYDYRTVIVGNEHSSNFGNVNYKGMEVNHQWSKSAEFESLLQNYTRKFLTPDVTYFSLLRPFYEIRIAEMFTHYPQYFDVFTSCNRSFKVHKERLEQTGKTGLRPGWCCECAKCAFVFAMLSAFLKRDQVVKIFGKDLYADASLKPMFKDLMGEGKMKPFDCVGTFEEMRVAYQMVHGQRVERTEVFKAVQAPTVPVPFRLLGMENVLILGYGKEGKATEAFLKARWPNLKVEIADQADDANYLRKQEDFDFVIKTPGISKTKVTRPYTTATNLFFAERKNFTIGVTGSKGKSTTASLIAHLVGGRLMGNIGKPMLSSLLEKVAPKEVFVLELSSYQLDDLEYSPDIAVVTNLFPEHMTYHGGLEKYYEAKQNIVNHQREEDLFIYNAQNLRLKAWAKTARSVAVPFTKVLPLKTGEIPLLGEHNLNNVRAAVTVARMLGVSDRDLKKGIQSFKSLPHRLEFVGTFKKIHFYDDAISTTPESTMEALKALKKVDTVFLGGEDRGYEFGELEKMLRKMRVRNLVLFPETGPRMLKSRKGFKIYETRSMEDALHFAYKNTAPGKICLLSCASPSYSLWTNFEEKGEQFQKWVKALA